MPDKPIESGPWTWQDVETNPPAVGVHVLVYVEYPDGCRMTYRHHVAYRSIDNYWYLPIDVDNPPHVIVSGKVIKWMCPPVNLF